MYVQVDEEAKQLLTDINCDPFPTLDGDTKLRMPWLIGVSKYACRHGPAKVPFTGVGTIVSCVKHSIVVLAIKVSSLVDTDIVKDVEVSDLSNLPGLLDNEALKVWGETPANCLIAKLNEKESMWLLCGVIPLLTTLDDQAVAMVMPFFASTVTSQIPKDVWTPIRITLETFFTSIDAKPWSSVKPNFQEWVQKVDAPSG